MQLPDDPASVVAENRLFAETAIDGSSRNRKSALDMKNSALLLTMAATLTLAACNKDDNTIVTGEPADPMANQLKNAPPVELPPAIVATHQYRCKDNSLVFVDWLQDNKGANVRTDKASASTPLKPGAEGKPPFTAEGGYSVAGAADAQSITVSLPGKGSQSCRRG